MFGPDFVHLANHDVTLSAVSRAPLAKLQAYKRRMGWTFPWASSFGSDFNADFNVWFTEEQQRAGGIEYNYRREGPVVEIPSSSTPDGSTTFAAMSGTDVATYTRERPGMSAFVLEDGVVYHTYSTYARGLDVWGMYQWLDRAPPRGATKRASGGAATTSTTSAERRRGCRGVTAGREISRRMASGKPDLKYVQIPYEEARRHMLGVGLSPSFVDAVTETARSFNEGSSGQGRRDRRRIRPRPRWSNSLKR